MMANRTLPALALALPLLLVAGGTASAGTPWYDAPPAKQEAKRVLKTIQKVMNASERQEGEPALVALRDRSWILRLLAVVRIETLGLERKTAERLQRTAVPDRVPLGADDPLFKKAAAFVAGVERPPPGAGPFETTSKEEAVRILTGFVTEQVTRGDEKPARKQELVEEMLSYRHCVSKAPRAWLSLCVLALTDGKQALKDLHVKSAKKAAGKDGEKVYSWYAENASYLYWHPTERRFRLDLEARRAKTSSREYRKKRPWGPDEGPNKKPKTHRGRR
jgi:hypothetical protein